MSTVRLVEYGRRHPTQRLRIPNPAHTNTPVRQIDPNHAPSVLK